MYVCDCAFLNLKDGRVAYKGDPVDEVETWPENIRRANLRLGYIKKVEDEEPAPSHHGGAVTVTQTEESSYKKNKKRR